MGAASSLENAGAARCPEPYPAQKGACGACLRLQPKFPWRYRLRKAAVALYAETRPRAFASLHDYSMYGYTVHVKVVGTSLQLKQRPESLGLHAAHRNFSLLLVIHAQLEAGLEPR